MSFADVFKKTVDRISAAVPKVTVKTDKFGITVTIKVPGAELTQEASFTSDGKEVEIDVENAKIDAAGEKGYKHSATVSSPLGTIKGGFSVSVTTSDKPSDEPGADAVVAANPAEASSPEATDKQS